MRWKALFFDKKKESDEEISQTYGFNTEKAPPQNNALIPFEEEL